MSGRSNPGMAMRRSIPPRPAMSLQNRRGARRRLGAARRPQRALAQVFIEAWPEAAFWIFIHEIGLGFRAAGWSWVQPERGRYIRFGEDSVGRFVEACDAVADAGVEIGRITAWEPVARVRLTWRQPGWPEDVSTDVEIRFEPVFDGTLLSVEHSGFERLRRRPDRTARAYQAAWTAALAWVAGRARLASGLG
jgi:hypothetical protein